MNGEKQAMGKRKPKKSGKGVVCEACGEKAETLAEISVGNHRSRKVCGKCFTVAAEGGEDPGGVRDVAEKVVREAVGEVTVEEHMGIILEARRKVLNAASRLDKATDAAKEAKEAHKLAVTELMEAIDGDTPLPLFDEETGEVIEEEAEG